MDPVLDDAELLRRYHSEGSQEAFSELVRRRLGVVYQAAFRRSGGRSDVAQDACQQVFTALARNARRLSRHPALGAWLYTAARYSTLGILRDERRRHRRERDAHAMNEADLPAMPGCVDITAVDALLDSLPAADRQAVILRYLESRPLAEVAGRLRIREDAARKRIDRALEKLRMRLGRHGASCSAAAAELLLASPGLSAMPAGIAPAALAASATAAAHSAGPLIVLLPLMTLSKTLTAAGVAGLILGAATVASLGWATRAFLNDGAANAQLAAARAARRAAGAADHATNLASTRAQEEASRLARIVRDTRKPGAGADPQAKAQEFLRAHPEIRAALVASQRALVSRRYAGFFKKAALTPSQVAQFETEAAQYQVDHLVAAGHGLQPGDNAPLPKLRVLAIFGEQAFNQYLEYNLEGPAREFTMEAARAYASDGAPLSDDTAQQITEAALASNPARRQGHAFNVETADWAAASGQLQNVLSAPQREAINELVSRYRYNRVLYDAMKKAREDGVLTSQP